MIRSCGMEGFKNAKKGTNIAAQATGIAMAVVSNSKDPIFFIGLVIVLLLLFVLLLLEMNL